MAAICLKCCSLPCEALGACCHGLDKGCSKCCSAVCGLKCCPENRPSPIFLTYTILFNVPIAAISVWSGVQAITKDCDVDDGVHPAVFSFVMAGMAVFFIGFAFRIYTTLSAPYTAAPDTVSSMEAGPSSAQQPFHPTGKSFRDRAWYTACHDPCTFCYMFAFPFSFIWAIVGMASDFFEVKSCSSVEDRLWTISAVMLAYLLGTFFIAAISVCWEINRLGNAHMNQQDPNANIPTAHVATHMFAPAFADGNGKPYAQQPPVGQSMQGAGPSGAAPVGTAIHASAMPPTSAQQDKSESVYDKMKQAFHKG